LPKGGRADPNIDGNIKNLPLQDGDELPLRVRVLEVEASQDAPGGKRDVILDKITRDTRCLIAVLMPGLQKKSTGISKDRRLKDDNTGKLRFYALDKGPPGFIGGASPFARSRRYWP